MAARLSRLFSGLKVSSSIRVAGHTKTLSPYFSPGLRRLSYLPPTCLRKTLQPLNSCFMITRQLSLLSIKKSSTNSHLLTPSLPTVSTKRSKVIFSWRRGRPKTVKAVIQRFYRLDWGVWIRPRSGRLKRLWKKPKGRKFRLKQHVFCNAQQSKLLDKMVTSYWTRKKYYVDDPYEPYNKRTNFDLIPEKPRQFYP